MNHRPEHRVPNDSDWERELGRALRCVDPPSGFASRVMQRAGLPAAAPRRVFAAPWLRAWAAAMVFVAILGGVVARDTYVRHEREKAALARRQFEDAMRVTDRALDPVREQLGRLGLRLQE